MKQIILSLLTIGLVVGASTGATLAFFTDTDTLASEVTTEGPLNLTVQVLDPNPAPSATPQAMLFAQGLRPGTSDDKCLLISNTSGVPARFKIYRSNPESGNGSVGDNTTVTFVLNPTSGLCDGVTSDGLTKYASSNFSPAEWQNVVLRGGDFQNSSLTPVRFLNTYNALNNNEYLVFRVTSTLDGDADNSLANSQYLTDVTVFGIQKEGSDADNNW